MVVQTILKPGTTILSPDGNLKVIAYETGMYDLEANGQQMLIDEDAVNHLIEERVWAVE